MLAVGLVYNDLGIERGVIHFLQDTPPYDDIYMHLLDPLEIPLCCIAVGTAFISRNEFEASAGRVIVFSKSVGSSLPVVTMMTETNGAVYDICDMNSCLVCAVNHAVHVYSVRSLRSNYLV